MEIGDMVEFWLPDGKKYRYGILVRKQRGTCYVVSYMLKNKRVYKLKEKELNYFRGEEYVQNRNR